MSKAFQMIGLVCVIALGHISIIGADGGGSDAPPPVLSTPAITYTGSTAQAVIDSDVKALILSAGAFGAVQNGSSLSGTGAIAISGDGHIPSFRPLTITQALENAVFQVDLSTLSGAPLTGAAQNASGSVSGPCGGTASYTLQYDEGTGLLSGSFNLNRYCNNGAFISGTTDVAGTINPEHPMTFDAIRFDFINLTDGGSTLNGFIDIDYSSPPISIVFDAFIEDNTTKTVCWAELFNMNITTGADGPDLGESPDTVDVEIATGKYYDPNYGFVSISTTSDFRFFEGETWPSSGILVATGDGNTQVQLEALSATQCRITADTNGDGALDDYDQIWK